MRLLISSRTTSHRTRRRRRLGAVAVALLLALVPVVTVANPARAQVNLAINIPGMGQGLPSPNIPITGLQSTNSPAGGSCRVTTVIIDHSSLAIGHGTTPVPCHQTNAPWQETDHSDDLLDFQCGDSVTITGILWELNLLNLWVELASTTVSGTIECLPPAQA